MPTSTKTNDKLFCSSVGIMPLMGNLSKAIAEEFSLDPRQWSVPGGV
ncbi:hypothetical protein [Phormidium sp. CCY1219]|nr:hypothetical protein [Phormidium sp. CCY1219]MEB3830869.1 hypothetical protein [Phormidium sp. CCY1219]